ncbi:MAG: hypothetical protein M1426_05765, partial [Patescibacteria group bacterium]|nr:hypothetical protein [Patescibacteria group bacterium]
LKTKIPTTKIIKAPKIMLNLDWFVSASKFTFSQYDFKEPTIAGCLTAVASRPASRCETFFVFTEVFFLLGIVKKG